MQVKGFQKAQFKKFENKLDAVDFMLDSSAKTLSVSEKMSFFDKFSQGSNLFFTAYILTEIESFDLKMLNVSFVF